MFELVDNVPQNAVIKVVGVGGGGGNAVEHMLTNDVDGVEFICANTDAQALKNMNAKTLLQLGGAITKGLGAGATPPTPTTLITAFCGTLSTNSNIIFPFLFPQLCVSCSEFF